jgi:hypothetical protein
LTLDLLASESKVDTELELGDFQNTILVRTVKKKEKKKRHLNMTTVMHEQDKG